MGEARTRVSDRKTSVPPDSRTETFVALKLLRRQLALGRRAVLPPHGQGAAQKRETTITIQFKRPPFSAVPRHARRAARSQSARAAHPARRRDRRCSFGAKAAGPQLAAGQRRHVVRLRRLLPERRPSTGYERLLLRLHDGRRDAVPAAGHGRSRLDDRRADPRRVEGAARPRLPELRRWILGTA